MPLVELMFNNTSSEGNLKQGERRSKEKEMEHKEVIIKAEKRSVKGKQVGALRRQGLLPGVIYGRHLDAFPIQMDQHDASNKLGQLTSSSLVIIDVDGKKHTAIVRDRQKDVIYGNLLHVDFLAVSLTDKLRTSVGIELVGEAPVTESYDVVIMQNLDKLEIECLPGDLPERIEIDLSVLRTPDDFIAVNAVKLGDKVEILTNLEDVIVSVTYVAQEAEEVAEGEEEPEILEKGKKEDEEEEEE